MITSLSRAGERQQRQATSSPAAGGSGGVERANPDCAQFGAHPECAVVASIGTAAVIALVSLVGVLPGGEQLYGSDAWVTSGVVTSTAGIVIPGFRAHDLFNLAVAVPILLASVWLARRGWSSSAPTR